MFSVLSWGGGHGRGAIIIITTIITISTTKFLPPLGAETLLVFPACSGM